MKITVETYKVNISDEFKPDKNSDMKILSEETVINMKNRVERIFLKESKNE